jgi:AbrB family transcriptional regulator, transcriptional pleiotropic regulator of transition state genes
MKLKATGIVRKVDELGRIVLPIELRRTLDIDPKDPLEIYVEGTSIILKKYQPSCIFCGEAKKVTEFKEKLICPKCLRELQGAKADDED